MIKTIGVIGAGQMGHGIAHVASLAGYSVILVDIEAKALESSITRIDHGLERQILKGLISKADKTAALARIRTSTDYAPLADAELVIEAVVEDEALKRQVFATLCPILKPGAIICSNTSSISITRLGSSTDRTEKFMGMHFMNPVPLMKLVEVIRGLQTSQETFDATMALARALGKEPVPAADFPGFIANRILMPMINEAVYALMEGVGEAADIDAIMKMGANHPMGPLALADLIGLDTCLEVMNVLQQGLGDSKYRPCPLLRKHVEAGYLGKKTGRGFYTYEKA